MRQAVQSAPPWRTKFHHADRDEGLFGGPPLSDEFILRVQSEFRVPVDSCYPSTYWICALDICSQIPTDLELRQIASYIEFVVQRLYNERYQRVILEERPLPGDHHHNTQVFSKGACGSEGWRYRRATWSIGPLFVPPPPAPVLDLTSLMDYIERDFKSDRWNAWKAAHPDIFGATPCSQP